jgi:hypothetical protein
MTTDELRGLLDGGFLGERAEQAVDELLAIREAAGQIVDLEGLEGDLVRFTSMALYTDEFFAVGRFSDLLAALQAGVSACPRGCLDGQVCAHCGSGNLREDDDYCDACLASGQGRKSCEKCNGVGKALILALAAPGEGKA